MKRVKFTSWRDGDFFIGFLNEYPDYQTQGLSKAELAENLTDLLIDLESNQAPHIHKVEELLAASGVIYQRGDAALARELAKLTDATPAVDRTISHEQLANETRFDRACKT